MTDQNEQNAQNNEVSPEEKARLEAVAANGRQADPEALAKAEAAKAQQAKDEAEAEEQRKQEEASRAAATKKEEEEAANKEKEPWSPDWEKEWITVGNEHADAAIELMKNAGMTPVEGNSVFAKAMETGNLEDIKWEVLEAKLGKATSQLVRTGINNYYESEYKVQQELVNYAHEQVGGEKGWNDVKKWAQKQEGSDPAFAKELTEWRKALSVGGFAARAAVDAIKARYEADPSNRSASRQIERGGTRNGGDLSGEPLSRSAYFKALDAAGGDRAPKAVVDALNARRAAGVKAGL